MERDLSGSGPTSGYQQASVQYVDDVTAQESAKAYKRLSYDLLQAEAGQHLLDVGCGTGDDVRALARLVGPAGRVVGVDFREELIAEARRRDAEGTLPTEYRVADAHALLFADQSFDGCRADRTFQHLTDPMRALAELVRVARPGARIVVAEPDWDTLIVDAPDRAATRQVVHRKCDTVRHGWMGRQLPGLFRQAGLAEIAVAPSTTFFTDYATADAFLFLGETARQAHVAGHITAAQATAWVEQLAAADRAGRFFCAITGFLVSGLRP